MSGKTAIPHEWPDIAGRMEGRAHVLPVRVYYEDTDFSGFVYHANYLKFCERGRSDFLRLCGIHHTALMRGGDGRDGEPMGLVVRRMVCDFKRPALIDDVLEVRSRLSGISGARMEIAQKIMRGADELFSARVTAALVNTGNGRPLRFPPAMRAVMERLLEEE